MHEHVSRCRKMDNILIRTISFFFASFDLLHYLFYLPPQRDHAITMLLKIQMFAYCEESHGIHFYFEVLKNISCEIFFRKNLKIGFEHVIAS